MDEWSMRPADCLTLAMTVVGSLHQGKARHEGMQLDNEDHPDPAAVIKDPLQCRRSRRILSRCPATSSDLGRDVVHAPGGPPEPGDSGRDDYNDVTRRNEDENVGPADAPNDLPYQPPAWTLRQVGLPVVRPRRLFFFRD
ncbi:Hypothetical predicted protein [Cloeon dipterum]|uniref:Uncharacterized protein n=1 Tax=Cloeon dipterum TaxID=197152 RepID=A0A8S1CSY2_9INSE|nr:Hypothetical predicted protein [Cloeon dipterum]